MRSKWMLVMVGVLAMALLGGCGKSEAPKTLKVGMDAAFAPFEFQDDKSKEFVGFDVDLMKAIGKQMGVQVEFQNMGFDALIPALDSNTIDVAASGMTIKEERKGKVNFSAPYYQSGLTIIVKKDNTTIQSFKDLEGKKIGVQIGTTGADEAKKIANAQVREFNTPPDAFIELKNGGVDAVINDLPVNQYYIKQTGGSEAKMVGDLLHAEDYGIAVAKKNTELAKKIDDALAAIKKNGEYDKIYEKWFGAKNK
ncbi:MAG: basic amino acid ABC transporter substrate-binding protein [Sporomusaceae bacterium]|nr:basic amino acid ABC transporter substrate-binding protein [Sporomusaceae bacterium]